MLDAVLSTHASGPDLVEPRAADLIASRGALRLHSMDGLLLDGCAACGYRFGSRHALLGLRGGDDQGALSQASRRDAGGVDPLCREGTRSPGRFDPPGEGRVQAPMW